MYLLLLATLASYGAPDDGMVTIDGQTWARLVKVDKEDPGEGHGPSAVSRQVRVRWDGEVAHVVVRWRVQAQEAGWWRAKLAGPSVLVDRIRWNGGRASTSSDAQGTYVMGRVDGPVEVVLHGTIKGDPSRGATPLELGRASIGTVQVDAGELEGQIVASDAVPIDDRWWSSAERLTLAVAPPRKSARDRRTLAVASSGVGLTVSEGELRGQARLEWRLRQGELSAVSFTAKHVGADLDVSGAGVAGWQRSGDRVTVRLDKPVREIVQLQVRWSVPLASSPQSTVQVATVVPGDAFRVQSTLQLAKDSELEIVPSLAGWTPVAASHLDVWGTNLIEGSPTAAYKLPGRAKSGTLSLLRFVPAKSPEVMVDVAAYTMTASAEGRTLTRALYTVRNERAGNLRFQPPEGHDVIGMRVAGQTAVPARTGDHWVIPLPRSIETVKGLVSFPVEVILLGKLDEDWRHREVREIRLPRIGAPVAVNRVTLTLPPTWADELEIGEHSRVDEFSEGEGIAYGFGVGGVAEAAADQLWQDAMGSYMDNEFDQADELLDQLKDMGADNENLERLRSNLDVVQGRASGGESAMSRRVVAQAWSRGDEDRRVRERVLKEAEQQLESGDYEAAEKNYRQAEDLSKKLSKVSQKESMEEQEKIQYSSSNMVKAKKKREERAKDLQTYAAAAEVRSQDTNTDVANQQNVNGLIQFQTVQDKSQPDTTVAPSEDKPADTGASQDPEIANIAGVVGGLHRTEIDFDGVEISGELMAPEGAYTLSAVEADKADEDEEVAEIEDEEEAMHSAPVEVSVATMSRDEVQRAPASRDRPSSRGRGPRRSSGRGGGGGSAFGGGKSAAPEPPPPPPVATPRPAKPAPPADPSPGSPGSTTASTPQFEFGADLDGDDGYLAVRNGLVEDAKAGDAFEPLQVSSTSMSVVVPVLGQTIRYQHLLLPADADVAVHVEARAPRSSTRSLQ